MSDFKIATQTWSDKSVRAAHPLPVFTPARIFKADEGTHELGAVVSLNASDEAVAASKQTLDLGDGDAAETNFTGAIPGAPLAPGTLRITTDEAEPKTLKDDGKGGLYGAGKGTINYASGLVDVTFDAAPANGSTLTATAYPRLLGVVVAAVDTSREAEGVVLTFGPVDRKGLRVDGAAPDEAVMAGLRERLIFPL